MTRRNPQLCTTHQQPNGQGSHRWTCHISLPPSLPQTQVWSSLWPGLDQAKSFHHYFAFFCSCFRDSPKTVQGVSSNALKDPLKCSKRKRQGGAEQ